MSDSDMIAQRETDERDLRIALMRADLDLKQKQSFWETPRNLLIMAGAFAAVVATLAGLAGYKLGSQPQRPIIIQMTAPPTR